MKPKAKKVAASNTKARRAPAKKTPAAAPVPTATPGLTTVALPRIGATTNDAATFAGIARGPTDGRDYMIEVLAARPDKSLTHAQAKKWAQSIGGALPAKSEGPLLFANVPELFDKDWYWLATPSAGNESSAWSLSFYYGGQLSTLKVTELRAFAVRRLPI